MGRHVKLRSDLSSEELKIFYFQARNPIESRRWHLLWLISDGYLLKDAAQVIGVSSRYASSVVSRYNKDGKAFLQKKSSSPRKPRNPPLLSAPLRRVLARIIKGNAPDGGLWTGPKVAQWMSRQLGRPVAPQRGWDYLKRLGFSWLRPRPRSVKASDAEHKRFKKKLKSRVSELKALHEPSQIEVWCEDEHRVGLKPIVRRVWAKTGSCPKAFHRTRYEWVYVYGFCCPQSGENFEILMPGVNLWQMQRALEQFDKTINPKGQKKILLVVDRAGWHNSTNLLLPQGLELIYLPPCSPELQPSEELWKFLDEVLANQVIKDINDLEDRLIKRSCWLMEQKDMVRKETLFHWWPRV